VHRRRRGGALPTGHINFLGRRTRSFPSHLDGLDRLR
jgi:hypothetical protein